MVTSVLLRGLCGYVLVNILTLSPTEGNSDSQTITFIILVSFLSIVPYSLVSLMVTKSHICVQLGSAGSNRTGFQILLESNFRLIASGVSDHV